jgi:hypothetical protein
MLHNLRTQKETLKSSARKCGDSSLREPAFRNTLGKLDRIILQAERALLALKQAQTVQKPINLEGATMKRLPCGREILDLEEYIPGSKRHSEDYERVLRQIIKSSESSTVTPIRGRWQQLLRFLLS